MRQNVYSCIKLECCNMEQGSFITISHLTYLVTDKLWSSLVSPSIRSWLFSLQLAMMTSAAVLQLTELGTLISKKNIFIIYTLYLIIFIQLVYYTFRSIFASLNNPFPMRLLSFPHQKSFIVLNQGRENDKT